MNRFRVVYSALELPWVAQPCQGVREGEGTWPSGAEYLTPTLTLTLTENSTAAGGMTAVGVDTDLWCMYDAVSALLICSMCYHLRELSALLCGTRTMSTHYAVGGWDICSCIYSLLSNPNS